MTPPQAVTTILLLMPLAITGCSPASETQTDDAKKRALVENVSNSEAAEYYTYRTYEDADGRPYQYVPYFFASMDSISEQMLNEDVWDLSIC